jgi:hypothetical protein
MAPEISDLNKIINHFVMSAEYIIGEDLKNLNFSDSIEV